MTTGYSAQRRRPIIEEIEPRILYSADFAPIVADAAPPSLPPAEYRVIDTSGEFIQVGAEPVQISARELIFVDARTPELQRLLADLGDQSRGRDLEVVVLESDRDGVAQISEALSTRDGLAAVHIVSHGEAGAIQLGSATLDLDSLTQYASQIRGWGQSFAADGDLLLYGCDVAASADGRALLDVLARLTGADVAASDDPTGSADLGGDWDLEYQLGPVQTEIAVSSQMRELWSGVLASVSVTTTDDVLDGDTTSIAALLATQGSDGKISLREAIIATNNTGGADQIILSAGTYRITIGGNDDLGALGDLDIRDALTITGAGSAATIVDGNALDRVFEVLNNSTATITGLTVSNGATAQGGGVRVTAGSSLDLTAAILSGNTATSQGGAIQNLGTLGLTDVRVTGNNVFNNSGGGLYNSGTATLTRVTVDDNNAKWGGGIYNAAGSLTLTNVTVSGNSSSTQYGGGIYNEGALTATNATITANSAALGGGGIYRWSGPVSLKNTIVAGNTAGSAVDFSGAVSSAGNNLIGSTAGSSGWVGSDLQNVAPLLDTVLKANGGTTPTHALLAGSLAINAGTAAGAPLTDQRGVSRLGATDIGAYEYTTIAYEPFAYAAGPLNGANGGIGWGSSWSNAGTSTTVIATGLQNPATAMPVSGGAEQFTLASPFQTVVQSRNLASAIGTSGTTAWLSFLVKPGGTAASDYAGLEFGGSTVAFAGYNGTSFVLEQAGGVGRVTVAGITPTVGQTYLLTVKMDFAAGADNLTLYVNPTPGLAAPDSTFTASKNNVDLGSFTHIGLAGGRDAAVNNAALDEIRLGATYADVAPRLSSISGTIYNDVDADADVTEAGTLRFANATVLLYKDNGNGVPGAGDTLVGTTTTNASGQYSFTALADGDYWVVIDSKTLGASGYNGGYASDDVWAEQTYGVAGALQGAGTLGSAGALYGGRNAATSDNASSLTTAEHITRVTAAGAAVSGIDAGFSFNAIVNTRGDTIDDDGGASGRLQQGSLRQFLINSNALTGVQAANFSVGTGVITIAPTAALPTLTDAVVLDATTQEGFAGAPLVELNGAGAGGANGLALNASASGSTIRGFVINRFGTNLIQLNGSDGNVIAGNYLGTDVNGASDLGASTSAVLLLGGASGNRIGGTAPADRNVISGNDYAGVAITGAGSDNNLVQGNFIGIAANGSSALGNSSFGVVVWDGASGNQIGGAAPGAGNVIAYNGRGVVVDANTANAVNNAVLGNSIYANSNLGIDLYAAGVRINDAGDGDSGPNNYQNYPVLTNARTDGTQINLTGTLNSLSGTPFRIEFFASSAGDPSGYGEAERYLGYVNVTTNGAGNASFDTWVTVPVAVGEVISATATRSDAAFATFYDTSEFAANITATVLPSAPVNTLPGPQTVAEDTTLSVTGLSVADANNDLSTVKLSVTNGVLSVSLAGGASVGAGANNSSSVTLAGTQAQLNAALATLQYLGNANYYGADTLTIVSTDAGSLSDTDTLSITVNAVNDAPTATNLSAAETYTEDTPLNLSDIVISDVDSASATATLTLSSPAAGSLSTGTSGAVTSTYSAGTGVWSASGAIADVNTLLAGVTFTPAPDYNASFTIATSVSDGVAAPITGSKAMTGTAVNDPPALTTSVSTLAYTENDAPKPVDAGLTVNDVDSATLISATVSITVNYASGQDVLAFTDQLGISGSWNAGSGVLTLTGSATLADYQTALRSVTYVNTSAPPNTATRTVSFVVNDGVANSTAADRSISVAALGNVQITAAQDTYILTGSTNNYGASTSLVVDRSGPSNLGNQRALLQFDLSAIPAGATITSATLQMQATQNGSAFNVNVYRVTEAWVEGNGTGGAGAANWVDRLPGTAWTAGGGATFDPAVVATLNTAAIGQHNWDLTSLVQAWYMGSTSNYGIILGSPDTGVTTVTYDSSEGTTPPRLAIAYTVAPVLTTTGGTLAYTENGPATAIDPALTVSDADSANLMGATVSITANYASGQDVLAFTDQLGITGSWNAGSGVLTLTGSATLADYQTALRSVTYVNTSDAPSIATRTVSFVVVDDGAASSAAATRNISVAAVNDPPVITSNGGGASAAITVAENQTAVTTVTSTDVDGGAPVYAIVGGADAVRFSIDAVSGALRFVIPPNYEAPTDVGANNVYDVIVGVSDGSLSDTQAIAVTVTDTLEALTTTNEQRVNTVTADVQETSAMDRGSTHAVAVSPAGSSVVVWSSLNQDQAGGWGVYVQRYDQTGAAVGGPIAVNQTVAGDQLWASVAIDVYGRFVVAWTSANQDGTPQSVYARQFAADGSALGTEFRVNTTATGSQYNSSVAMDANGNFVVVWQGNGPGDTDGIFGRRFNANGTPRDAVEFRVNTDLARAHYDASVTMNASGAFAVTWDNNAGVQVRRYDSTGAALGGEINVDNGLTAGNGSIALADDGSLAVVWREGSLDRTVYLQRYSAAGAALGAQVQVNTTNPADQTNPSIAMDGGGNFIVTWEGNGPGDADGVFGQKFNATGSAVGGEFRINSTTAGTQAKSSLAMLDLNNFVVVWSGQGPGDTSGVFTRQYGTGSAPVITSFGGAANVALSVAENSTAVATVTATDADLPAQTLTYSIAGGADAGRFSVNASTGVLTFSAAPNFEAPGDAGSDNIYDVTVQVSDGMLTATQTFAVTVTNVNEAPVHSVPGPQSVNVNTPLTFSAGGGNGITVSDVDIAAGSFSVAITATNGTLTLGSTIGLSGLSGNGTAAVVFTAPLAALNSALEGLTFTPDSGYYGAASILLRTDDQGNSGAGGAQITQTSVSITVNYTAPVLAVTAPALSYVENDPAVAVDPSLTVTAGTLGTLTGAQVSISANYANGEDLLAYNAGALPGGVVASWNAGTGTLTFTGSATVAQYQSLLRTVTYQNVSDAPSTAPRTASFAVDDGVTTAGGARQIAVSAVNDAPVATIAPIGYSLDEDDSPRLLSGISVGDVDAGGAPISVTLAVGNGTLTLGTTTGLTVTGGSNGSASITFTATIGDANAALATVAYQPGADFNGTDTVSLSVDDQGNSGSGGARTDSDSATITVNAINDAPVATIVPATYTATEQTSLTLAGTGLSIADVDAAGATVTATLSVGSGTLTVTPGTTGATVAGSGSNSVVLSGTLTQINSLLAGNLGATVSYIINSDTPPASDLLTLSVDDGGNTGTGGAQSGFDTATINITAVNDAPSATIIPASYAASEQTTLTLAGSGLSIADVDASGASVTATLSVVSGTLNVSAGTTGVSVAGSGSNSVTLTGTVTQINDLLSGNLGASADYIVNSDAPPVSDTLTLAIDDGGNSGSGGALSASDTATINITAVNDAPTATIASASYAATEQVSLALHGTGLSIADADAGAATVTATLSVVSGTLTVSAGTTGVSVAGSGSNSVTLTGTLAQINDLLAGNLGATADYIINSDTPPASDTLTLAIDDGGNTGVGGALSAADTASIDITPVDDAPTMTAIADQSIAEDTPTAALAFTVGDAETAAGALTVTASSSDTALIPDANLVLGGIGANRTITVTPAANAFGGPVTVTLQVSDGVNSVQRTFQVSVAAVADTPSASNAVTNVDTQTTSGLVLQRNPADGAEVTHFKITAISGGTLYQNDGITVINSGEFITIADGNAGLKFTPSAASTAPGSFDLQAAIGASDAGLGGGVATATITVNAVAPPSPPSVLLVPAPLLVPPPSVIPSAGALDPLPPLGGIEEAPVLPLPPAGPSATEPDDGANASSLEEDAPAAAATTASADADRYDSSERRGLAASTAVVLRASFNHAYLGPSAGATGAGGPRDAGPTFAELLAPTVSPAPLDEATSAAISLEDYRASLSDATWVNAIDSMREEIDGRIHVEDALVASSVALGGSLSVGYVLWLLRGGLLLTSLLSSLPAWHSIDPLPVLAGNGDDDDAADDADPLERLFGKAWDALRSGRGRVPTAAAGSAETSRPLTVIEP